MKLRESDSSTSQTRNKCLEYVEEAKKQKHQSTAL